MSTQKTSEKKFHRLEEVSDGSIRKRLSGIDEKISSQYEGYKIQEPEVAVDVLKVPTTDKEIENFFSQYVVTRKPCKLIGAPSPDFPLRELRPDAIRGTLPEDEILTVETKSNGGFGSGAKRLKMSFGQFMEKVTDNHGTDLYLTTQYNEHDPDNRSYPSDEEENSQVLDEVENMDSSSLTFEDLHDDYDDLDENNLEEQVETNGSEAAHDLEEYELRLRELYQPPLTNLVKTLPDRLDFLKYLIPQQINLWIGAASDAIQDSTWLSNFDANDSTGKLGLGRNVPGGGSSSGLHHDHADNIYIPVNGHKRFTLFSPSDAAKMYTVGDIQKVFNSGVIDYLGNEHAPLWRELRDDCAIVGEVYKTLLDSEIDCSEQERRQYEAFLEMESSRQIQQLGNKLDPPSFSTIPTAVVHIDEINDTTLRQKIKDISMKKWPLFFKAHRTVVDVKPGEMLFLPTGWFHEVTSFGNGTAEDNVHVAVNYWFIPPNGKTLEHVYSHEDNYWPDDYMLTEQALAHARRHSLQQ